MLTQLEVYDLSYPTSMDSLVKNITEDISEQVLIQTLVGSFIRSRVKNKLYILGIGASLNEIRSKILMSIKELSNAYRN